MKKAIKIIIGIILAVSIAVLGVFSPYLLSLVTGKDDVKMAVFSNEAGVKVPCAKDRAVVELENKNSAISMEEYKKRQLDAKSNTEVTEYKGYKRNNAMEVLIEDIPMQSIEVQEFSQINGTTLVSTYGVLVKSEVKHLNSKKNNIRWEKRLL